ncbi:hypothetical protein BH23ACT5_BH23ACT5_12620 [soil metagenome]
MHFRGSQNSADRQRSSLESFLDEYQLVRIAINLGGLALTLVLLAGGWWQGGSKVTSVLVPLFIGGHAAWCHFHRIRAPHSMLLLDTTLAGAVMLTLADNPSVAVLLFAFVALLAVLFTQGVWMAALLTYATAWYVVAALSTGMVDTWASLIGDLFLVAALVMVIFRVRRWLGRLDANRSQMLGTVSHELRNNLTGVLGLTEVVATINDLEPAEARELIGMANQQATDATAIVEDLLTASRLEGSELTLTSEKVDINAEVTATAHRFRGTGTAIGLTLADDLPAVWADSLRVRQAIRNLLSNAIRYGGPNITVATRHSADTVEVTVRDDGEGVPPDDAKTIFLPYRRSTQGRRDASSIGLGLWICRQIAHMMGGSLEYQRRGDFTEFVLTLPTAPAETPSADAASVRSPRRDRASETSASTHMRRATAAG